MGGTALGKCCKCGQPATHFVRDPPDYKQQGYCTPCYLLRKPRRR